MVTNSSRIAIVANRRGREKGGREKVFTAKNSVKRSATGSPEPVPGTNCGNSDLKFVDSCTVAGRKSANSLYSMDLATYGAEDAFDHRAAEGFIYVWGMPTRVWSETIRKG